MDNKNNNCILSDSHERRTKLQFNEDLPVMPSKKIEESESHFRSMADLIPVKISNADEKGNVTYFNKHWLEYAGMSFEDLRDFGYHKIMHPDEIIEFQIRFETASKEGKVLKMEMRFLNKDGDYKWHLNIASPVKDKDGKITMWVGSTTEIHEQLEQKAALAKAVKERTEELQNANDELILQNEEKEKRTKELINLNKDLTTFSYISSHDLQEPLRKIETFTGRILGKDEKNLSEAGKSDFNRIVLITRRMRNLINDLLSYSNTKNTRSNFEKIDLNVVVSDVIRDLEINIKEKNATVEIQQLCSVNIISSLFYQLMQNLISNALKFSRSNVTPHITIGSKLVSGREIDITSLSDEEENLQLDRNYCHLFIKDNGIGFDPQYSKRVFEVFQRLNRHNDFEGTGIGLAICKRIVENHQGIITARGKINEGAVFDIYLPV